MNAAEPDVHIWACALDEGLNDAAYIVPGLWRCRRSHLRHGLGKEVLHARYANDPAGTNIFEAAFEVSRSTPASCGRCHYREGPSHSGHGLQWRAFGFAALGRNRMLREQLGVPSGQRHEICRGLHAEQNAIIQAARYGIDIEIVDDITTEPCRCARRCSSMQALRRLCSPPRIPINSLRRAARRN